MEILRGTEERHAQVYFHEAACLAIFSPCYRSKCGSVVVKDNEVIGRGYNSPPKNKHIEYCFKDELPKDFKSDKTCCVHAEQRAIMDALRNEPEKIKGATIYFTRINEDYQIQESGEPYCTICSKLALDVGLDEFVLWHDKGICVYGTEEYNEISFKRRVHCFF